jgi:SulP family sulfate permease
MKRLVNLFSFPWLLKIKDNWQADSLAGLSVAIVALPQALAYANLAGLPAHLGLIAAGIPAILSAFFTSSSFLITGPVAISSLLTAVEISKFSGASVQEMMFLAAILALLVGIIQLTLSWFKLGSLLNYVASPVFIGLTTAAALVICLTQIVPLFGMRLDPSNRKHQIIQIAQATSTIDLETTFMGIGSLIALFLLARTRLKSVGVLIVVASAILSSMISSYSGPIVGQFSASLTNPQAFDQGIIDIEIIGSLFVGALMISLVGFMEGVSIAKSLAKTSKDTIRPNRELAALGVANVSAGIIGSFPIAGSVTRTALNRSMGAKSNMAAIVASGVVLVSMFLLAPFLAYLPKATLAAVIVFAVYRLINFRTLGRLLRVRRRDGLVAIATFATAIIFAPRLNYGIFVGIVSSIVVHLHRGFHPPLGIFFCSDRVYLKTKHMSLEQHPTNKFVLGVTVDWSLSFQNCSYLQEKVLTYIADASKKPKYVLIFARSINHIDASAEEVLEDLQDQLESRGITLLWCGMKPQLQQLIKKTGMLDYIGKNNMFNKANEALAWVKANN